MVEITNRKSAQAWLETQPHQVQVWMSARAALRALPALATENDIERFHSLTLPTFRALLLSGAAGTCPSNKLSALAQAATVAGSDAYSVAKVTADAAYFAAASASAAAFSVDGSAPFARFGGNGAASATVFSIDSANSAAYATAPHSVDSAADAANSAAFSAYSSDTVIAGTREWRALWQDETNAAAKALLPLWKDFKTRVVEDKNWSFFIEFYEGCLHGRPLDWDLIFQIAVTLTDKDWESVETAAAAIRRVREEFEGKFERPDSVPELERTRLVEHVRKLLENPDMTAIAAEGAAETLERAIRTYLDEAPANCLPDELRHLEKLPPLFRAIATTTKSGDRHEAKVERLTAEIEALNLQVAKLEADLEEARSKTVDGIFKTTAIKVLTATFLAPVGGAAGLAVAHFFGTFPTDAVFENLRGWIGDLQNAVPAPEAAPENLPPTTEV